MTIFELLKADHRKVEALMDQIEKTSEMQKDRRISLFSKLRQEFLLHSVPEEVAVYSPLNLQEGTHDIVMEGYEEHNLLNHLFEQLTDLSPSDETWTAKFTVLSELINHHVEDEEGEMFEKMKYSFGPAELDQMARDFKLFKHDSSLLHLDKKIKVSQDDIQEKIKDTIRRSSQTVGDAIEKVGKKISKKGGGYIEKIGDKIEHMAD